MSKNIIANWNKNKTREPQKKYCKLVIPFWGASWYEPMFSQLTIEADSNFEVEYEGNLEVYFYKKGGGVFSYIINWNKNKTKEPRKKYCNLAIPFWDAF